MEAKREITVKIEDTVPDTQNQEPMENDIISIDSSHASLKSSSMSRGRLDARKLSSANVSMRGKSDHIESQSKSIFRSPSPKPSRKSNEIIRPTAEARARWAMLASLAGISNDEDRSQFEGSPNTNEGNRHNGSSEKVEGILKADDSSIIGSILEMPDPDHFIRPMGSHSIPIISTGKEDITIERDQDILQDAATRIDGSRASYIEQQSSTNKENFIGKLICKVASEEEDAAASKYEAGTMSKDGANSISHNRKGDLTCTEKEFVDKTSSAIQALEENAELLTAKSKPEVDTAKLKLDGLNDHSNLKKDTNLLNGITENGMPTLEKTALGVKAVSKKGVARKVKSSSELSSTSTSNETSLTENNNAKDLRFLGKCDPKSNHDKNTGRQSQRYSSRSLMSKSPDSSFQGDEIQHAESLFSSTRPKSALESGNRGSADSDRTTGRNPNVQKEPKDVSSDNHHLVGTHSPHEEHHTGKKPFKSQFLPTDGRLDLVQLERSASKPPNAFVGTFRTRRTDNDEKIGLSSSWKASLPVKDGKSLSERESPNKDNAIGPIKNTKKQPSTLLRSQNSKDKSNEPSKPEHFAHTSSSPVFIKSVPNLSTNMSSTNDDSLPTTHFPLESQVDPWNIVAEGVAQGTGEARGKCFQFNDRMGLEHVPSISNQPDQDISDRTKQASITTRQDRAASQKDVVFQLAADSKTATITTSKGDKDALGLKSCHTASRPKNGEHPVNLEKLPIPGAIKDAPSSGKLEYPQKLEQKQKRTNEYLNTSNRSQVHQMPEEVRDQSTVLMNEIKARSQAKATDDVTPKGSSESLHDKGSRLSASHSETSSTASGSNGLEMYLESFRQQTQAMTAASGEAPGFLDQMVQLLIGMAQDALPEIQRRLEQNGLAQ